MSKIIFISISTIYDKSLSDTIFLLIARRVGRLYKQI